MTRMRLAGYRFDPIRACGRRIELRGLDKGTTYEVYDYGNRRQLGTVKGTEPYLRLGFKDNLLIRVRPTDP